MDYHVFYFCRVSESDRLRLRLVRVGGEVKTTATSHYCCTSTLLSGVMLTLRQNNAQSTACDTELLNNEV